MKIVERIAQIISNYTLSVRAFEIKIGASNGMIGRAISKKTDISAEWLSKIIEMFPTINSEWLITGEGEMLKSSEGRPAAQSPPATPIIYKSDPKDQEIIELQRKHIKLLEDKLSRLEDKTLGLGIAPSVDFTPPLMGAPANPSVYRSPRKK